MQDEVGSRRCCGCVGLLIQHVAGFGQGGDHQTVPVGEDFIVFKWMDALFPCIEKYLTTDFQLFLQLIFGDTHVFCQLGQGFLQMQNILIDVVSGACILKVAAFFDIENVAE